MHTISTTRLTGSSDQAPFERLGVLPWASDTAKNGPHLGSEPLAAHDPRSAYVETFWLPIVGPSTTLLMRRLADEFDTHPDGFELDPSTLSREIGLGGNVTKRSAFVRTLERSAKFNLTRLDSEMLYVRRRLPALHRRQVSHLSERLRRLHQDWSIEADDDGATRRVELVRATHLAKTLLDLGERSHEVEQQLHTWRFDPAIAWHGVQRALCTQPGEVA